MNILIVSATALEIQPFLEWLELNSQKISDQTFHYQEHTISILISGVGMVSTTFHLTRYLTTSSCDLAIQAGIGGAFRTEMPIGSVWCITEEQFGDLGITEADGQFSSVFQSGLVPYDEPPFRFGKLLHPQPNFDFIQGARGLTVNNTSGEAQQIEQHKNRFGADIESMEGAAFFYCCLSLNVPFLEFRSISNYIEPRNKANWNIPLAVKNLNNVLIEMLKSL